MTTHLFGKELFIRFTGSVFRKYTSIWVGVLLFLFGFEGGMCNLNVLVPDHCLSYLA